MNRIIILIFCSVLITPAHAGSPCTAEQVYANPLGSVGCEIELSGNVKKIISVSFPFEFILSAGGKLFLVQRFYDIKSGANILNEGEVCHLKGTILGFKKILYDGTVVSLPQIICLETQ